MRKYTNGFQVVAYVVGGLVAFYLAVGVSFIGWTGPLYRILPRPVFIGLAVATTPVTQVFEALGYFDEIRRRDR